MIKRLAVISLLILTNLRINVESKAQYVQPLMGGLQVCVPYDLANIWNRPVSLSPFLSTFLGLSLLYILFFGVITSPFGYMFGVPSQKYVLGTDASSSLLSAVFSAAEQWHNYKPSDSDPGPTPAPQTTPSPADDDDDEEADDDEEEEDGSTDDAYQYVPYNNDYDPYDNIPRSNSHPVTPILRAILQYPYPSPDFSSSMFQFIPDAVLESESDSSSSSPSSCQQLMLCYAHSSLRTFSPTSLNTFRVFTKILANVTEEHRLAIKTGLKGDNPSDCEEAFPSCPSSGISLLARIMLEGLPSWLRKSLILPQL